MLGKVIRQILARSPASVPEMDASTASAIERGNELAAAGDHPAAIACYDRLLALDPGSAVARNNRALSLMAMGEIRAAWADAEARLLLGGKTREFLSAAPIPRWQGEPLPAGPLLVLWEQGFGDIIQHLRFLPLAQARTGAVAFFCRPELAGLVTASFPDVEVIPADGRQPAWDRYAAFVPLLSLPHALGLDWATLPAAPYLLRHDPPPTVEPRVGIVWRSSAFDATRDCSLEDMLEFVGAGTPLASLQFGTTQAERSRLAEHRIVEAVGADFLQTARQMRTLAAVVSVDTSAAHLAAALGRPTLLLVSEPAAVRWMLGRTDSPWYPTLRILRKAAPEPWTVHAAAAAAALRSIAPPRVKLNLGSGPNPLPGYVNVDMSGAPDVKWNLEEFPWPWDADSVEEVRMSHVLEHLGASPLAFIGVMKELYRVCRDGARIHIRVPHPRHDFFLGDPTHVRPILPATLELFSLRRNREWAAAGVPNTPLARYHGVDFEIVDTQLVLDEPYRTQLREGTLTQEEALAAASRYNNVASEIKMTLRVVKASARADTG